MSSYSGSAYCIIVTTSHCHCHAVSCWQDYKDHIAELANKFVVIMDSMLDTSLSKVSLLNTSHHLRLDTDTQLVSPEQPFHHLVCKEAMPLLVNDVRMRHEDN